MKYAKIVLHHGFKFFLSGLLIFLLSLVYFAYNQQWILVRNPYYLQAEQHLVQQAVIQKKMIKHFFWHHDAWRQENADILWSDEKAVALSYLIASWLSILDEEKINTKKIVLEALAISPSGQEALCSFDRNPFSKHQSTFEKLMWIEGLLKSIRESGIKMQSIRFLVHHQPLHDTHLDFSNPWPITGFLET